MFSHICIFSIPFTFKSPLLWKHVYGPSFYLGFYIIETEFLVIHSSPVSLPLVQVFTW